MEKVILNEIYGLLNEYAIVDGMKSENRQYGFGDYEVKCWVNITEEEIKTTFYVYKKVFEDFGNFIFKCESFKELRQWLQQNIDKIN